MEISKSEKFMLVFGIPDDIIEPFVPAEAMTEMWAVVDKANLPIDGVVEIPSAVILDDNIIAPWWDGDRDGDVDPPDSAFWPKP